MPQKRPDYLSFLLRLWRDSDSTPWRASLEAPGGGEALHLPSLAALFAFLTQQTGQTLGQLEADPHDEDGGGV